jgi:FkbM family methyltransferase
MSFDTTSPWGKWTPKGLSRLSLAVIALLPVNPICRRLAFLLRKPVKKGKQEFYDVMTWGLKLRLSCRGNLTEQRWLTMPNFHDSIERDYIRNALRDGGVFLDIGANAGFFSFWVLSLRNPKIRVVSVEPSLQMLERVKLNLRLNELEPKIRLLECAVTPSACEVSIEEDLCNLGQTKVSRLGSGRRVQGCPLLDILEQADIEKPEVLKIDIEGGETEVLRAFFETAPSSRWPQCVVGEIIGNGSSELIELLLNNGYVIAHSTKMNGIFILNS